MAITDLARLSQLLTPVVEASGHDLEGLEVTPAGRRRVVRMLVDKDGGTTLDDVAEVSRAVSGALDDIDVREPALLGGAYVLEVGSPGVDRPLTLARHWRRNVGRLVTAVLLDGTRETGRLTVADGEQVQLGERLLALSTVERGLVQVEFSRPDGPDGPDDDTDGTDEISDETDLPEEDA